MNDKKMFYFVMIYNKQPYISYSLETEISFFSRTKIPKEKKIRCFNFWEFDDKDKARNFLDRYMYTFLDKCAK